MDIPIKFLLDRSREALRDLQTKKLNASANLRKRLEETERELIESCAEEMLLELLIAHGEELILEASAPAEAPERKVDEPKEKDTPLRPPYRYEFWRSEQRHVRKRAAR